MNDMSMSSDSYTKSDGERELEPVVDYGADLIQEHPVIITEEVSASYTKLDGVLSPAKFIIISGGEQKERKYFAKISDIHSFPRISIEFVSKKGQGLSTSQLLDKANEINERLIRSQVDEFPDSIFLLSDRDHFYPEIVQIRPECESKGYKLIVSNPCFEIWLYYSYFSSKPVDFVVPCDVRKISHEFKTYLGDKTTDGKVKGVNPVRAIFNIETAMANSESNYQLDENAVPVLFSTDMHILAKELLPLIKPELVIIQEQQFIRAKKFKR
jgi:hypothetical protein